MLEQRNDPVPSNRLGDAAPRYYAPFPIIEWDTGQSWSNLLQSRITDNDSSISLLFEAERAYNAADFSKALNLTASIIESDRDHYPGVVLSALTTHWMASIASGDADTAYNDLREIKERCSRGLEYREDSVLYGTSIICALRVESVMMARICDIPAVDEGIDGVPSGYKAILGYLMVLREIRANHPERAYGMAYAFKKIIGSHHPLASVTLRIASAGSCMLLGKLDEAAREFSDAWEIGWEHGVFMPFVELNFLLFGLPRSCLVASESDAYKVIESHVKSFREGWHGLRVKCGFAEDFGDALTPLEAYVLGLVALGWRNKAIAQYLNISENTVKHQLTSVYQKTGIANRAEVRTRVVGVTAEKFIDI